MKIAVPATSPRLDAPADSRFGRCSLFLVVDSDTLDHQVVENTVAGDASGAGIAAATLVADAGAEIVIAGQLGPKAIEALLARNLSLYQGLHGSVRDQIDAYSRGNLHPVSISSHTKKSGPRRGERGLGGGGQGRSRGGRGRGGQGR